MSTQYWTPQQWAKIPLKLKQRWWNETQYGKVEPSTELIKTIQDYLDVNFSNC